MERIIFVDRPGKEREADEYSASYVLLLTMILMSEDVVAELLVRELLTNCNDTEQGTVRACVFRNKKRILSIKHTTIIYISTTPSQSTTSYTVQYYALQFYEKFEKGKGSHQLPGPV